MNILAEIFQIRTLSLVYQEKDFEGICRDCEAILGL